ncbi:MAG: sigma-54 dependent transcriptional regulator, partial [Mariprofundaceae bacterium]|nr:sigma-54 dependent transcriptional regulator [Mariprofundaceae bacterium]
MNQAAYILLVDDEDELRTTLQELLEQSRHHVTPCANAMRAREAIRNGKFDLVLLDIRLPDGDGLELLREFRSADPDMGVIMMTGYAEVDTAVDAIRLGADDFLKKPFDMDELLVRIEELFKKRELKINNKELSKQVQASQAKHTLIGQSSPVVKIRDMISLLSDSDSTVLITGESGTGKEVVARMLHNAGTRAKKPMVSMNCGAIPEELLESELFGHVKGAFTGAIKSRPGRFEVANGGTIFLDEIGDMSPSLQVKLLRVLQERKFEPVGSTQSVDVDVRVIAATHRNLEEEIRHNRFREDLYYRLNIIPIEIPALREREDDVLLIAEHFIQHFNESKQASIEGFSDATKKIMLHYRWPGNVRELQNLMERVATLKRSGTIEPEETAKMLDLIQEHFQLAGSESLELLTRAMSELAEKPELGELMAELGRSLSDDEKEDIAVMALKVIAADGR